MERRIPHPSWKRHETPREWSGGFPIRRGNVTDSLVGKHSQKGRVTLHRLNFPRHEHRPVLAHPVIAIFFDARGVTRTPSWFIIFPEKIDIMRPTIISSPPVLSASL